MSFLASLLLVSVLGVPSVMGLTFDTPAAAVQDGTVAVTWTTEATDPKFSILLIGSGADPETFDVATGIDPTTLKTTVGLGFVPPGSYTLQAVNAGDIDTVITTSGAFNIAAAGTAAPPAGDNAGAGGAAVSSVAAPPPVLTTAAATTAAAASTGIATSNAAGGPPFDPAGVPNVGNGAGKQFIGGQCLSAADCASGCCAGPSGICSGVGAQTQAGKTGCGFVSGGAATSPASSAPVAAPPAASPANGAAVATTNAAGGPPFDPAGVPNVGNGAGKQFIGGQCLNAADCASGCCAGPSGICSGVGAQTQAGKTGCGFVSGAATSPANPAPVAAAPPATGAATTNAKGGPPFDPAGVPNVGNGAGKQFIGGQCLAAADCGSGCCAGPSGICSGVGAQTQAGKTGCGFVSKRFISRSRSLLA
ncbi:hypothetical protein FB451DRAFT_1409301 [Mycena latifolia]|nr:hypothetical protein FB451DRAFT_1409301 [Mycena latifolia]